jgi:O-methyltransferase involved in polyketide biosynthesis
MAEPEQNLGIEADHTRVAPTAYGVAYLRTFSDIPLTTEIFQGLSDHMQATGQTYLPGSASKDHLAPQLEARYKLVDNLIEASGMTQVIELAAGIAPRGLNLATKNLGMNYVELDLPGVIDEKQAILASTSLVQPPNLTIVRGNALSEDDVTQAVKGFSKDKPIAVVNEGLMRYLSFDEKTRLAHNVYALLSAYGGAWITPDVSLRQALTREDEAASGHIDSLKKTTGIDVSQNVFEDEEHAKQFFERLGFSVERHSFLEVTNELLSPDKLGMSSEEVQRLNEPCIAFVMTIAS